MTKMAPAEKSVGADSIECYWADSLECKAGTDIVIVAVKRKHFHAHGIALRTRPVTVRLQAQLTITTCSRCRPSANAALNLSTYLTAEDIELQVDAKDVFAVEQITWMIDGVITVIVSLFCGGSGVALIYSGLPGIIAGAVITLLVLMIGKNPMEKAFLKLDIPKPARKLIPRNHFRTRLSSISDDVRASLKETLAKEKTNEITDRMVAEISEQIEECLTKMAEVVEIPLG